MFEFLFRRRANRAVIDQIYHALVARGRDPVLFTELGIVDNFEGRFDALSLFVILTTRRLKAMPAPAPDLAQDLIDHVFAQFDRALREAGVGDLTVPKRMKTIAAAFMGRASAYDQALQPKGDAMLQDSMLQDAIFRNVYASDPTKTDAANGLAAVSRAFDQALAQSTLDEIVSAITSAPMAHSFAKA